jgi:hydrocephalus-inducing protein
LRREVTLDGNTDVTLSLIEPATGRAEQTLPVRLSARAQFSKYSVTPARGLHFGPNTYGTTSKPWSFEVCNLGEFPFTLRLSQLGEAPKPPPDDGSAAAAAAAAAAAPKGPKAAAAAAAAAKKAALAKAAAEAAAAAALAGSNQLRLGQFVFDPAEAVVQPGGRQEVAVTFKAEGSAAYRATAGLSISERDFGDHPDGLPYEVAGESCIPGAPLSWPWAFMPRTTSSGFAQSSSGPRRPRRLQHWRADLLNWGRLRAALQSLNRGSASSSD